MCGLHVFLPRLEVAFSFVVGFLCWALSCGAIHVLISALFLLWVLWRAQGAPQPHSPGLAPCCPGASFRKHRRLGLLRSGLGVGGLLPPWTSSSSCGPYWLHADVFLLSEPLPPARAACCWRFLGSRTRGSARRRGAALPMCIFRVCALHFTPTFPEKWSFEKDLVVLM